MQIVFDILIQVSLAKNLSKCDKEAFQKVLSYCFNFSIQAETFKRKISCKYVLTQME